jgi:HEAT repeat protein
MRLNFVFSLLIISGGILVAALFLKQHLGSAASRPVASELTIAAPMATSNFKSSVPAQPLVITPPIKPTASTPEQRQATIDAEIARLQELSMGDDPNNLSVIEADLTNPEKEIREAAIEATKEFGSKDAIPALNAAVANSDDTEEKIDLLEAVDFLSLPSIEFGSPATPTPEQIQAAAEKHAKRHPQTKISPPASNN